MKDNFKFNLKEYYEDRLCESLKQVAFAYQAMEDSRCWKEEAPSFEQYCQKFGLTHDQIRLMIATPAILKNIASKTEPQPFARPELLQPFMYLADEEVGCLAWRVAIKNQPITPELIEQTKAQIFLDHPFNLYPEVLEK